MAYGKRMAVLIAALCLVLVGAWFLVVDWGRAADVPRMTKERLRSELNNPNITILDVRAEGDWEDSEWKIKGAVRELPKDLESWMEKYPKDKTLVLYCA